MTKYVRGLGELHGDLRKAFQMSVVVIVVLKHDVVFFMLETIP
jgi:hypothetical protein